MAQISEGRVWPRGTARAIGRSLDVYWRDAARAARMRSLLSQLVPAGGLAFDIGAHLGDRSACLAGLGCRVVAIEPQAAPFRALRLLHRRTPAVAPLRVAVGRTEGRATLRVNRANPLVSTLSRDFVDAAADGAGWRGQVWDAVETVPVTKLDALIAAHGRPDFVKIDVEGFEAEVLAGLTAPLPALSFEVTSLTRDIGRAALRRLTGLGSYAFNFSLGESHRMRHPDWVGAAGLDADIAALSDAENAGDVYARMVDARPARG